MTYYGKVRGASSTAKFHVWVDDKPLCQSRGGNGAHEPPRKPLKNRPRVERLCIYCEAAE